MVLAHSLLDPEISFGEILSKFPQLRVKLARDLLAGVPGQLVILDGRFRGRSEVAVLAAVGLGPLVVELMDLEGFRGQLDAAVLARRLGKKRSCLVRKLRSKWGQVIVKLWKTLANRVLKNYN